MVGSDWQASLSQLWLLLQRVRSCHTLVEILDTVRYHEEKPEVRALSIFVGEKEFLIAFTHKDIY